MKMVQKFLAIIFMCMLPFMLSCGGGGGGGGTTETGATLTNNNAPAAGAAALQTVNLSGLGSLTGIVHPASISSGGYSKPPLRSILDKVLSISRAQKTSAKLHAQGSTPPTTLPCSGGGTVTFSETWTGPDDDPVNYNLNLTFDSCKEYTTTMNGNMSAAFEGPLSAFTKLTISMPDVTISDTATNVNMTTGLTMVFTDMTLIGNEFSSATITLIGTASGTLNGNPINEEFNITMAVSSGATGFTATMSGKINASCIGGWMTITTNKPIFIPSNADCPTDGEIVVSSGGNNVKIVIASDSKITYYFNDNLYQTYNNCTEANGLCGG